MNVTRYTIDLATLNTATTATTININIPLSLDSQEIGQSELIEDVFVDIEVEKAINPISDYDKVRYLPLNKKKIPLTTITYSLNLTGSTDYKAIGFSDDDIKYEKSNFKQSFLYLAFYDSPNPMTQRLINYLTIFSRLNDNDFLGTEEQQKIAYNGNVIGLPGQPVPANEVNLDFIVENPILKPMSFSEGYHLYDYRDELKIGESKEVFMRASFKNAKTGRATNLMVKNEKLPIDKLVNELYTKFILFRDSTGYYYKIDESYQGNSAPNLNNVTYGYDYVTINLYQIQSL